MGADDSHTRPGLLSYLLPPWDIYHHLAHFTLPRGQGLFLAAATLFFSLEFLLARHLFCRFGCAVGLFQSLVWMANKRALVVGFARERVDECVSCHHACDNACPMRLKPRAIKRSILACTQCAQCIEACEQVQGRQGRQSLLYWVADEQALDVSDRELGHKPKIGSGDRA